MIHPKKLEAFANRQDKHMPFPKKGKGYGDQKHEQKQQHSGQKHGHHDGGESHDEPDEDDMHAMGDDGVDVQAIGDRVQSGNGDEHLMRLADGIDEEDGNPPAWVADMDIWAKAKDAVEPYWDDYDQPYAVVAHVYDAMGGTVEGS